MKVSLSLLSFVSIVWFLGTNSYAGSSIRVSGEQAKKIVSALSELDVQAKSLPWFETEVSDLVCYERQEACMFTDASRNARISSVRIGELPLFSALKSTGAALTPIGSYLYPETGDLFDRAIRATRVECWKYPYGKLKCRIEQ